MDLLIDSVLKKSSVVVVGLDPSLSFIPGKFKKSFLYKFGDNVKSVASAILEFNKRIIEAVYDVIPAVKVQSAYYELYGYLGIMALEATISFAKSKGLYVIMDGKRNDIGRTMEAYSSAYLGNSKLLSGKNYRPFFSDALTVNGYLGSDCLKSLLSDCAKFDRDIFVLVKTSNPSSSEFQDIKCQDDELVYEKMGQLCRKIGDSYISKSGYSRLGFVVGATYPREIKKLRNDFEKTFFLIPGYGAQGGNAENVAGAFRNGLGAVINSSKSILTAWTKGGEEEKFDLAARKEVLKMNSAINKVIK